MESTARTESRLSHAAEQAPRRGPVPLDPALLAWVAGGVASADIAAAQCAEMPEEVDSPHGRW